MEVNSLLFDIQNKFCYFLEHPTAAIIKDSFEFKAIKYKERYTHGCPFDRGSSENMDHITGQMETDEMEEQFRLKT